MTNLQREAWSPEEEKIFNDLIVDCLRKHLAGIIHADGRLESRKNSIKSHINAFVSDWPVSL